MAQHDDGVATPDGVAVPDSHNTAAGTGVAHTGTVSAGTAVVRPDEMVNPGFPPHRERLTDIDPAKEKRAATQVSVLFFLSIVGSIFAVAAYIAFPIVPGDMGSVRLNTLLLGLGISLGLLGIGVGAVEPTRPARRPSRSSVSAMRSRALAVAHSSVTA
jgi:ubiquinol-cytochrome c reductase iron-sulfur subunit